MSVFWVFFFNTLPEFNSVVVVSTTHSSDQAIVYSFCFTVNFNTFVVLVVVLIICVISYNSKIVAFSLLYGCDRFLQVKGSEHKHGPLSVCSSWISFSIPPDITPHILSVQRIHQHFSSSLSPPMRKRCENAGVFIARTQSPYVQ